MAQILNTNSSYPIVVLTSVEMDCGSIVECEFIDIIKNCLAKANKEYKDLVVPKYVEFITKEYAENLELSLKKAKAYAENKWKTEKKRNKYLEEVKINKKKDYNDRLAKLENISIAFFDFDGNCNTENGINSNCILRNDATEEQLKACFHTLCSTKYFNKAIGLKFGYKANPTTYTYSFRPFIELVLPEDIEKVVAKERENFEKSILDFYSFK